VNPFAAGLLIRMISYKEILYVTLVPEIEKYTPSGTIAITIIANQ
jgi:hypothetical protein